MVKNGVLQGWIRIGITLATITVMGIAAVIWAQADIKEVRTATNTNAYNTAKLEGSGCYPSKANQIDIAVVKTNIGTIQSDIEELKTKQEAGFTEILRRLPK